MWREEQILSFRNQFERDGYLLVPGALSAERVAKLNRTIDEVVAARPASVGHNITNIINLSPDFLALIEEPSMLALMVNLLGYNIQLSSSKLTVRAQASAEAVVKAVGNPNDKSKAGGFTSLDWHRDGPSPQYHRISDFSAKVGIILSDLSEPGRGNMKVVPGSHREIGFRPQELDCSTSPEGAIDLCGRPGDIYFFTQNIWHAAPTNASAFERRVIYLGYCALWTRPLDYLEVDPALLSDASPARRQLLGQTLAGGLDAYLPSDDVMPLKNMYWVGEAARGTYEVAV